MRLSIAYFAAHLPYGCRRAHQELLRCFSSYGLVSQHLPGGRYVLATSSMPSCSTVFASPYKHTKRVSCCLRFNKTRGFRFTIQAHMDRLSCFLRLFTTQGFASPYKHTRLVFSCCLRPYQTQGFASPYKHTRLRFVMTLQLTRAPM